MFSDGQIRTWATNHLKGGAWYLDCLASWTHLEEEEFRRSLEAPGEGGVHLSELQEIDEFAGLDDEAREKAISKRNASDKLKADKVAKQVQDAALKMAKKLDKAAETAPGNSGEKKKKRPKPSTTVEPKNAPKNQTPKSKEVSQYLALTENVIAPRPDSISSPGSQNEELILNESLSSMYSFESEHDEFPAIFKYFMAFIAKVLYAITFILSF